MLLEPTVQVLQVKGLIEREAGVPWHECPSWKKLMLTSRSDQMHLTGGYLFRSAKLHATATTYCSDSSTMHRRQRQQQQHQQQHRIIRSSMWSRQVGHIEPVAATGECKHILDVSVVLACAATSQSNCSMVYSPGALSITDYTTAFAHHSICKQSRRAAKSWLLSGRATPSLQTLASNACCYAQAVLAKPSWQLPAAQLLICLSRTHKTLAWRYDCFSFVSTTVKQDGSS
jgi:hypothetical protein